MNLLSWLPWRRHVDTTDEARACMDQLEQRDTEVHALGVELRAAQRRNHFSVMVNAAIARKQEKTDG